MIRTSITALTVSALLAECGGSGSHEHKHKPARTRPTTVASAKPIAPPAPTRPAASPPDHAYVTDDARATVTVIDLADLRVTSTIHVGAGAHHLCFDITNHMAPGWHSASRPGTSSSSVPRTSAIRG